jgi:SAM-dependent methyltransferase
MKIRDLPGLAALGIASLIYDLLLFILQSFIFGGKVWWWRLNLYYGLEYFWGVHRIANREAKALARDRDDFIYGETPCISFRAMMKNLDFAPGDLYVDLGCGRGQTVFYAQILYGLRARGCDLITQFIEKARLINCFLKIKNIEFFTRDMLHSDISDAKIILVVPTTFTDDLLARLTDKLKEAPAGSYIISVSRHMEGEHLELLKEEPLWFSWGRSPVYFYLRREGDPLRRAADDHSTG